MNLKIGRQARAALVVVLALTVLVLWWALPSGGTGDGAGGVGAGATASGPVTSTGSSTPFAVRSTRSGTATPAGRTDLRSKALAVLAVVDRTGEAPPGYVGGRQFMNDGRGGTAPLPRYDPARRRIVYHEYDVNPHRAGVDRGPQRVVVGDDGSAWSTADHYVTWVRLR